MSDRTTIEWCDTSWSAVTGCSPVSEGCERCWAQAYLRRFKRGTEVRFHPDKLEQPLRWKKPRVIAVCLMGDLFHEDVPFEFIDKVFAVMVACPQHFFLVLTKRPQRTAEYLRSIEERPEERDGYDCSGYSLAPRIGRLAGDIESNRRNGFPPFDGPGCVLSDRCRLPIKNVGFGVSVENQARCDERILLLLKTPAAMRFVSLEPLLGPVKLFGSQMLELGAAEAVTRLDCGYPSCSGVSSNPFMIRRDLIHWVIVGAESGPGARPMNLDWVRDIRDQCVEAGVSFFLKQTMLNGKRVSLPELDGRQWAEIPDGIRKHKMV